MKDKFKIDDSYLWDYAGVVITGVGESAYYVKGAETPDQAILALLQFKQTQNENLVLDEDEEQTLVLKTIPVIKSQVIDIKDYPDAHKIKRHEI